MSSAREAGTVAFFETDASGRFHYTNALKWAERAEHALYRFVGMDATNFPRRSVSASFRKPLGDGDNYVVELTVGKLGNSSITYRWSVLSGSDVAVEGSHTVVHIDADGRPTSVPDALRAVLADLMEQRASVAESNDQ